MSFLRGANRNTGNWVPGVERCSQRALPCGNPQCADEAMRAKSVNQSNPHASEQAYNHAVKIANQCLENCANCPLNLNQHGGVHGIIRILAGR